MKTNLSFLFVFLIFAISCMPIEPFLNGGDSYRNFTDNNNEIFIINSLAETISIIDPLGETIYNDIVTTGRAPNDIYFKNNLLFVVNSMDNNIIVYDEDSMKPIRTNYLGKNRNPWMIIPTTDDTISYIPNFISSTVTKMNIMTGTIYKEIAVGRAPQGGRYFNGYLYICNSGWDGSIPGYREGTITVIDTSDDTVLKTITVATNPQSVIIIAERNEIHIVCAGKNGGSASDDGYISIIDLTAHTLLTNIFVGGSPGDFAINTNDHTVYLSGVGGIAGYNYLTKEVTYSSTNLFIPAVDPLNEFYSGITINNNLIYTCNFTKDSIEVYSLIDGILIKEYLASDGTQVIRFFSE